MRTTSKWKINDLPILPPIKCDYSIERQAKTAERSEDGIYDDDRLPDGIDCNFEWKIFDKETLKYMYNLVSNNQYINFTFEHPGLGLVTGIFYCGGRKVTVESDSEDDTIFIGTLTAHLVAKDGVFR